MKRILISDGQITIHAMLNNTTAAKDFGKRLPFSSSGYNSGIDYCFPLAKGHYDPTEMQRGWSNGDIHLGNGWFALLYTGEEISQNYTNMMIIGHTEEQELSLLKELSKKVNLTVTLAQI